MLKRILIVDDEEDIREVVQASLEDFAGWLTVTAASGLEGLEIARTEPLDAIILDISMPDMDGLQLYAALQAAPETRNIPVIVLTAKVLPADQQQLRELPVAGIITKPFAVLTVWRQVAEILDWPV